MRSSCVAVLVVALVVPAVPVLAQVKLLDLVSDRAGEREPAPDASEFANSADQKDATAGGLKLNVSSVRGLTHRSYWARATVTGGRGDTIRSVEYRFRHEGRDVAETVSDRDSNFALVSELTDFPTIAAHVTVIRGRGRPQVVVLRAEVVPPGTTQKTGPAEVGPPPVSAQPLGDSAAAASSANSAAALPPGVRFSVNSRSQLMPGGARSGRDFVRLSLEGDAAGLRQISRVEYTVSGSTKAGDANRGFYLEDSLSQDRWPIAVKITWRNGRVTNTSLSRP